MNAALRANWPGFQWSDSESGSCEPNQYPTQNYFLVKQLLQLDQSLKGSDRNWISKYYQFSEEVASIYRMHQLIPDKFNFGNIKPDCYTEECFTDFGIVWVELDSIKDIIARHYQYLVQIIPKNAFLVMVVTRVNGIIKLQKWMS